MSFMDSETLGGVRSETSTVWQPIWPPVEGPKDVRASLACAARILAKEGFSENYAGHISCSDGSTGNFWCTPWGKWWGEMCASDMILLNPDGDVVQGQWGATPAIHIHTGIHNARPDATCVVHNHPRFATLLASHAVIPTVFTQTGLILEGEIRLISDYTGAISNKSEGAALAGQLPSGTAILLANHGAITIGESIPHAVFKAVVLELICRQEYDSRVMCGPGTAQLIPEEHRHSLKRVQAEISVKAYWEGAVRSIVEDCPEVLQ